MSPRIHPLWPSWLTLAGLAMIFVGERIFAGLPSMRWGFALAGAAALGTAVVVRGLGWSGTQAPDREPVLRTLLVSTAGLTLAMIMYGLTQTVFVDDDSTSERMRGVLWALWPIVLAAAGFVLVFVESAVASVAYIDRYEHAQIRRSTVRGLSLALFLAIIFVGNYLVIRHDQKIELGAGHSATANAQTRQIVRDLTKEVRVVLFYPRANDVYEKVRAYFDPLPGLNKNLQVERLDHALATDLAKKARVSDNGFIALFHENNHRKIQIGKDLRSARNALRRLDFEFSKALIQVTTARKVAYFFTGHDERIFAGARKTDKRPRLTKLKRQLEQWQYQVRSLSVAEGSTTELPKNADLVVIIGPEKPFLPAEIEVLKAALQRGARLLIAVDGKDEGHPLNELLAPLGVKVDGTHLAATMSHVPLTRTSADRSVIFSNQFSSHASVTTMTRNTGKIAAIFYSPTSLEKNDEQKLKNAKVDIVLTARPDTFRDPNGNRMKDKDEVAKSYGLAAAVTVTSTTGAKDDEGRAFVLADADVLADRVFDLLPGNVYFLRDIVLWLQKADESFTPVSRKEDVKIVHKGSEDAIIFYGTTLGVPALILIGGAFATRRRRRS